MAIKKTAPAKVEAPAKAPAKMKAPAPAAKAAPAKAAPAKAAPVAKGKQVQEVKEAETKTTTKSAKAPKIDANDLIVVTAHKMENMTADDALAHLRLALEEQGQNDFLIGGLLATVQLHGYWEGQNHDNFRSFIEAEYGIPYRKAMYLIEIYNALVESGIHWDQVKDLGWTKLKEIAKLLTQDNVDEWLERANEMTALQLIEYVREYKKSGAGDGEGTSASESEKAVAATTISTLTFKVHPDQKEVVNQAIEKAQEDLATEYPAVALTHIATTYIEGGTGKKKAVAAPAAKKQTLSEALAAANEKDKNAALKALMEELGYEKVLEHWEECYPEVNISVEL